MNLFTIIWTVGGVAFVLATRPPLSQGKLKNLLWLAAGGPVVIGIAIWCSFRMYRDYRRRRAEMIAGFLERLRKGK